MFAWLLLCLPLVWLVVFRVRRRRMYQLIDRIPRSEHWLPVIGIAHKFAGNTEDIMKSLQTFSYEAMREGIVATWLCHIPYFVVTDPVDLEMVMKTCLEKDDVHRFMRKVIGYGAIFAPVPIWRRRRKIMVPAFAPKVVEKFVMVISNQSEKLAKQLDRKAGVGQFSIWPFIASYTLDTVCETAMGVKIDSQSNPESPYLIAMNKLADLIPERMFHLWLQPDWLYRLFVNKYREHQKYVKLMQSLTDEVIKKKRQEIKSDGHIKPEMNLESKIGLSSMKTFLGHLISLSGGENGYTDLELQEECLTLIVAGTDTSAVAIGYTFMLLAKYPDVQEKVYKELCDVLDGSDRPIVKEDLLKLNYQERVIKESLRLYPPVPVLARKVLEDTKLPSGRILPGGSGVVVSIWGVHRDPKYWGPDAEAFDPDRFLPERFKPVHACSYMPFSNGPRNCVGYQYALFSIKAALSSVLRRFKVVGEVEKSSTPHIRVKMEIMMKAVDGYQVALERRCPGPL